MKKNISEDIIAYKIFPFSPTLSSYNIIPKHLQKSAIRNLLRDRTEIDIIEEFNYKTIKFLLDVDFIHDYNSIAMYAAFDGYEDILYDVLDKGADNYNEIAAYAAYGGNGDILSYMIDKYDIYDYAQISEYAAKGGNLDIFYSILDV